ncbi:hypothetical protein NDU88_002594 [Pleurodeles waltl]|uniref:Uncharacterized protein n=1 Tax=Pleurodeles waltl TaxID=8319 RepID=A0AAV7W055_PLEWA|nr:hypothetical protein NDU88_002594 [Pleurodeles waltl]
MIHQSIVEHREETKAESGRTQLACCKMQGAIRRVAKTCTETPISNLEDDAVAQWEIRDSLKAQMEDTHWKLVDLQDRSRQNNLQVLGIPEGLEGADPQRFVVILFKEAFPDLA